MYAPHEETQVYNDLIGYLSKRDVRFVIFNFLDEIRRFLADSQDHHYRLIFRDTLARCLGLDMAKQRDRDALWTRIAKEQGLDRRLKAKWLTGQIDPSLDDIQLYLRSLRVECRWPSGDEFCAPLRTAITRTLLYIYVFPPERLDGDTTAIHSPIVRHYRNEARRHVHYRKYGNLNQHAIDTLLEKHPHTLPIDPDKIGAVRAQIESDRHHPLWFSWLLFHYATKSGVSSTNRPIKNPFRWIWDESHLRYPQLWSGSNGGV